MRSITSRLVLGTSIVLTVFVVLVAISVSYSVHQRAETARFDRLQGLIYGILGATDINNNAELTVNVQALPDPRLNQSVSGLYAELVGSDGKRLWQSNSTASWLPAATVRPIGDWLFESLGQKRRQPVHRLQLATAWEFENGEEFPFIVHVVDEGDNLANQLKRFDQTLWATLLLSAACLLIVQLLLLRYSLKPLHDIAEEVADIEQGNRHSLGVDVPIELQSMTQGLNALLAAERERHSQYRHLLDDLAHSLKTPLSVLQNLNKPDQPERDTIIEQTNLMRQSIERHSQRATFRSPRYLAPMISVKPIIERISATLIKLHYPEPINFAVTIDASLTVRMDEADLFEVLGNLLENACKYGGRNIAVATGAHPLSLVIEDDGPGFPDMELSQLTQRGLRADTQTTGTGLGLAAAHQLMASYGGKLDLQHRPEGGARVLLNFA